MDLNGAAPVAVVQLLSLRGRVRRKHSEALVREDGAVEDDKHVRERDSDGAMIESVTTNCGSEGVIEVENAYQWAD
jgi:hypothetical protein